MAVYAFGIGLIALFGVALASTIIFGRAIKDSLDSAEKLVATQQAICCSIDVIIPAFNEAKNIKDCVKSVLASCDQLDSNAHVWVADDQSTDQTLVIAQMLAEEDERIHVIPVPPRPIDSRWYGKNWACHYVSQQVNADYLLFLDADVLLQPDCLTAALQKAQSSEADLLTVCPNVQCRIWTEWLIQPPIFGLIVGFCNFGEMNNDENRDASFGFGPFMMFRRGAYQKLDGHRRVAGDPVEDVALAKLVKTSAMRLRAVLSNDLAQVRMYDSFSALFEGWTKNFHMGFGRSVVNSLVVALMMFVIWSLPQLSMLVAIAYLWFGQVAVLPNLLILGCLMLGLSLLLQIKLFQIRTTLSVVFPKPFKYGCLSFLGGILVGAIAIASIIKTETGWGWTWRGRTLVGAHAFTSENSTD